MQPHLQHNLRYVIIFVCEIMNKYHEVIVSILKYLYFEKVWSTKFCLKLQQSLLKQPLASQKIERVRNYVSKCNL